ncbi:MAG: Flp/Fap pilin component, partial [Sphingomonadales bacterium]|nr:Flp/Fap pilin component [Sphingomonadales bacterium]
MPKKAVPQKTTLRTTIALMRQCLASEDGATAIEYAMIASGVAVAISSVVFGLGSQLKTTFY